jgi:hypothetical protein
MELKTIENILNKYVIEATSMGRSVILADRIDEVAEDIHQFLLQQTPCTTLREELEQMLSKELKLTGKYEWEEEENEATERITALSNVMKMIDERLTVT